MEIEIINTLVSALFFAIVYLFAGIFVLVIVEDYTGHQIEIIVETGDYTKFIQCVVCWPLTVVFMIGQALKRKAARGGRKTQ